MNSTTNSSLQSATTSTSNRQALNPNLNKNRWNCFGCQKPIEDNNPMKAGMKYYHQECFVCANCDAPLKSHFLQDDERVCCVECFVNIKCSGCGLNLFGDHVQVMSKGFHVECYAMIAAKKKNNGQTKNKSVPDGKWKS